MLSIQTSTKTLALSLRGYGANMGELKYDTDNAICKTEVVIIKKRAVLLILDNRDLKKRNMQHLNLGGRKE